MCGVCLLLSVFVLKVDTRENMAQTTGLLRGIVIIAAVDLGWRFLSCNVIHMFSSLLFGLTSA